MNRSQVAGSPELRQRFRSVLETPSLPFLLPHPLVHCSFTSCLSPHGYIAAATAPHIVSMFKGRRKGKEVPAAASCHQGRKKLPRRAGADHTHSRRPEPGRQGVGHTEHLAEQTRTDITVINHCDSSPGAGRSRGKPRSVQREKGGQIPVGTRAGPQRQRPLMSGKCWGTKQDL